MSLTMQQFGLDALSAEDRLHLAEQLWDSVAGHDPLTDAERTELDRRIAEADADADGGIPWEVIRADARARWRK